MLNFVCTTHCINVFEKNCFFRFGNMGGGMQNQNIQGQGMGMGMGGYSQMGPQGGKPAGYGMQG